jgi:hypothetical protein
MSKSYALFVGADNLSPYYSARRAAIAEGGGGVAIGWKREMAAGAGE